MKRNPQISLTLSTMLLILFLLSGCEALLKEEDTFPETMTVKIEVTSPKPLATTPPVTKKGECKIGDILRPGDSCFYPGTNKKLSVFENDATFISPTLHVRGLKIRNGGLFGEIYTIVATRRGDKSWIIEDIGLPIGSQGGQLELTVSEIPSGPRKFFVTPGFEQTIQLSPNIPVIYIEWVNNTFYTLSIRLIVLTNDEIRVDKRYDNFASLSKSRIGFSP